MNGRAGLAQRTPPLLHPVQPDVAVDVAVLVPAGFHLDVEVEVDRAAPQGGQLGAPVEDRPLRRGQEVLQAALVRLPVVTRDDRLRQHAADGLGARLQDERGRVPDLSPAFADLELGVVGRIQAAQLERDLDDQLERAATEAFRTAFLVAAALALLALLPALALRDRP